MRNVILIFLLIVFTGMVFGQRAPDVLIERYGRTITSSYQGQTQTIIAEIFLKDEVIINIEYYNGSVILSVSLLGNHFTEIDLFNMEATADRMLGTRTNAFNTIVLFAEKSAFIDRAAISYRPSFGVIREFRNGQYNTKFEIMLPNYRFDVFKYVQSFTIRVSIKGELRTYTAGSEETRLLQDAGLIISLAGLR